MSELKELYQYSGVVRVFGGVSLYVKTYQVLRHTPKGVWVSFLGGQRWVSLHTKKRLAYPTKKEALEAYKHRLVRHLQILNRKTRDAESILETVKLKVENDS